MCRRRASARRSAGLKAGRYTDVKRALADQVLSVTLSSASLSADGISRATITAQLDPRTDIDKRNVTFTTTAGTLIAFGKEGTSITVPADSGTAVVELRSSTTATTARLDVTVASGHAQRVGRVSETRAGRRVRCVDQRHISSSRRLLEDRDHDTLKRLGTPDQRAVKVETSAGTLTTAGQTNARTVTVTAAVEGGATGTATLQIVP